MLLPNTISIYSWLSRSVSYTTNRTRSLLRLSLLCLASSVALTLPAVSSGATKVAFVADQGVGENSQKVLSMIKDEGTDIVLIQGDLGYFEDSAVIWEQNLTDYLGRDFPVLAVVGNHEDLEWPLYAQLIQERVERADGLVCSGNVGVKANCNFKTLQIVQVAQGIYGIPEINPTDNYDGFIRSSFNGSDYPWKVCSWHMNQNAMQVYSKPDSTGWDIYDACLDSGAMVAMGHAHTYSRTHLMTDYRSQSVAHFDDDMLLEPGRSFAVVSGLGGHDIRPQVNYGEWFASVYTQSQGATHGALFCTLEQTSADCYFKAVDGSVPDRFTLRTGSNSTGGTDNGIAELPDSSLIPPTEDSVDGSIASSVFRRTDKDEYRWIALDDTGQLSSRWISENCAMSLGGEQFSGTWSELMALAPRIDTSASPCDSTTVQVSQTPVVGTSAGYVFSRTDKDELRWIDTNADGSVGSVWIDSACANRLGGTTADGDWDDLMIAAPAFDTLEYPCAESGNTSNLPTADVTGRVFSRTDKDEYRWIDEDEFGEIGNIWIDKACSDRLGGVSLSGDWFYLNDIAPGFDTLVNPCY